MDTTKQEAAASIASTAVDNKSNIKPVIDDKSNIKPYPASSHVPQGYTAIQAPGWASMASIIPDSVTLLLMKLSVSPLTSNVPIVLLCLLKILSA